MIQHILDRGRQEHKSRIGKHFSNIQSLTYIWLFLFFGPMCEHKNTKLQLSTTTRKKGWIMICVKKTCALISKGSWYIQGGYKWCKGIKKEHFFASYMIMYIIHFVYSKPPSKKQLLCWQFTEAKEKFLISAWRSLGHYNDNKKRAPQN